MLAAADWMSWRNMVQGCCVHASLSSQSCGKARAVRVVAFAGAFFVAATAMAAPRPLGLNVHDSSGVGLDATRDAVLGAAPKYVRIDVNWFDVEKSQGQYDWTVIDAVVDGAK